MDEVEEGVAENSVVLELGVDVIAGFDEGALVEFGECGAEGGEQVDREQGVLGSEQARGELPKKRRATGDGNERGFAGDPREPKG